MSKIIVAGAGHGGLVAAAHLAKNGYDVTVYEKKKKGTVGYDWTDAFDRSALTFAGIELPADTKLYHLHPMAFYGPSQKVKLIAGDSRGEYSTNMDRKAICKLLISFAEENGVKICYNSEVLAPIVEGDRVIGINVRSAGKIKAVCGDLIIDALGCNSALRLNLPAFMDMEGRFNRAEVFYSYRAFYELTGEPSTEYHENHFFHNYKPGLCWFMDYPDYCDILIGRFDPFTDDDVAETVAKFRETYPELGTKILRGGQHAIIPIRKAIGRLVLNGYVAVGDSAAMTIPLIGSGISNSVMAGKMLADSVIAAEGVTDVASLWRYQVQYFKKIGAKMAKIDKMRELIGTMSGEDVDFLLENGVLTTEDISAATGGGLKIGVPQVAEKAYRGKSNLPLLGKFALKARQGGVIEAHAANIPEIYNEKAADAWIQKYRTI
ncbi:MAG: NAD(P)/FAD-dependent oxidoreductase [Clostridia bacterium]|nr:NAD(P)/FAD-dependent oxidoreductase [Clostridia bacterium]